MATVRVRGTATADVPPDRAHLHLTVSATSLLGPAAAAEDAAVTLDAIRALFAVDDIDHWAQTPRSWTRTDEQSKETSYICSIPVKVLVRDLETLTGLVNELSIIPRVDLGHTHWFVDDPAPHVRAARIAAIADARQAADDYAAAVGQEVFVLVEIADPGLGSRDPFVAGAPRAAAFGAPAGAANPDFHLTEPEPIAFRESVEAVYRLAAPLGKCDR